MPYYVRKIARNKWPYPTDTGEIEKDVNADVLGSCIRTSENTLSLWEISDLDEITEVVLAMVANFEKLDTIVLLVIEKDSLLRAGLKLVDTDGETSYASMVKKHRDIYDLKYSSIGVFVNVVLETLMDTENAKRFTAAKVKNILKDAIEEGKIELAQLKDSVQSDLKKVLEKND